MYHRSSYVFHFHQIHNHWACPGEAVSDNYCTNSFVGLKGCFRDRPWCYTTDPEKKWEYCNIPMCLQGVTGNNYNFPFTSMAYKGNRRQFKYIKVPL